MPRVVVEFFDITTHDGWTTEDEVKEYMPVLCTALGKVVHEDEHLLILAALYSPDRVGYAIIIPKGCIVTRTDV